MTSVICAVTSMGCLVFLRHRRHIMTLRAAMSGMIFPLVRGVIFHFMLGMVVIRMLFMFVHHYLSTIDKVSACCFNKIKYLCCCDKVSWTLSYRPQDRQYCVFFVLRYKSAADWGSLTRSNVMRSPVWPTPCTQSRRQR